MVRQQQYAAKAGDDEAKTGRAWLRLAKVGCAVRSLIDGLSNAQMSRMVGRTGAMRVVKRQRKRHGAPPVVAWTRAVLPYHRHRA